MSAGGVCHYCKQRLCVCESGMKDTASAKKLEEECLQDMRTRHRMLRAVESILPEGVRLPILVEDYMVDMEALFTEVERLRSKLRYAGVKDE